jgi:hypothetical protein
VQNSCVVPSAVLCCTLVKMILRWLRHAFQLTIMYAVDPSWQLSSKWWCDVCACEHNMLALYGHVAGAPCYAVHVAHHVRHPSTHILIRRNSLSCVGEGTKRPW